jgi:hypothetical protein
MRTSLCIESLRRSTWNKGGVDSRELEFSRETSSPEREDLPSTAGMIKNKNHRSKCARSTSAPTAVLVEVMRLPSADEDIELSEDYFLRAHENPEQTLQQ